ncbi:BspA family leucine-rich repeat surface protein [Hoylesella buccalis]|uniref:BspA family leucine-rich repeat surface protein n=1 Tax=Hoylesella buccalis TaxID=28127 RepID=UPI00288BDEC0|nr:BspA family leucine-rich repeat surface protein [Hoylesella buccalis]
MRNHLLSLLVALLAVTGSLPAAAQEAYAVFTSDGETLTFYYDNLRDTRRHYGHTYNMPKPGEPPAWAGNERYDQEYIKHAVFDASFSGYRPTSIRSWFEYCINLQDIEDIRNLNTEKVTDMSSMFKGCIALTSLDLSKFNTENVTDMSWMFGYCHALKSLDVSNFNTQNVTDMDYMFYNCSALTSLDVSKFNTQNVTDMSSMFSSCTSLATIFCNNNWKVRYKIYDSFMFDNCTKLKGTNTAYKWGKTGIEMANPTTGYFTSKATGIDHVKTADGASDGKIYDLSGSRVNESYKGIVIKNGKKYIQK